MKIWAKKAMECGDDTELASSTMLAIQALKEKQERDNKCDDCINCIGGQFGLACYECGRYYADGFKSFRREG